MNNYSPLNLQLDLIKSFPASVRLNISITNTGQHPMELSKYCYQGSGFIHRSLFTITFQNITYRENGNVPYHAPDSITLPQGDIVSHEFEIRKGTQWSKLPDNSSVIINYDVPCTFKVHGEVNHLLIHGETTEI